jgi:hypothetical protein
MQRPFCRMMTYNIFREIFVGYKKRSHIFKSLLLLLCFLQPETRIPPPGVLAKRHTVLEEYENHRQIKVMNINKRC